MSQRRQHVGVHIIQGSGSIGMSSYTRFRRQFIRSKSVRPSEPDLAGGRFASAAVKREGGERRASAVVFERRYFRSWPPILL